VLTWGVTRTEVTTPTFPPPQRMPMVYVPGGVEVGTV
jgi:hypothetical protein